MKRYLLLILGVFLVIAGLSITYITYVSTFKRVPIDKNPPKLFIDFERLSEGITNQETLDSKDVEAGRSEEKIKIKRIFYLSIPAINLKEPVYEGVSRRVLMSGPGHIPGSSYPGEKGNCAVSGHRVTFGGPFRNLHKIKAGDSIYVEYKNKQYTYQVIWIRRVKPKDIWVIGKTEIPSLTLTTCDPPYSAKYRLVVRAVLVN
ncbi:MAG: class E sortase [Actinobacteria bacterium]|nr:class E sortase [Actinomycetota bacterium]